MTQPTYHLIYKHHSIQLAPQTECHEWRIEKKVDAFVQTERFATLEVNRERHTFSLSLLRAEAYPLFLAKLMASVTKALQCAWDHQNATLSFRGLEEFLHLAGLETPLCKSILIDWLERGGDPDSLFYYQGKRPISLIHTCIRVPGVELLESFLDHGGNPQKVTYTQRDGKVYEASMAHFAVSVNRMDLLNVLISRKIPINTKVIADPEKAPTTPLTLAINAKAIPFVECILKNSEPLDPGELGDMLIMTMHNGSPEITKLLLESKNPQEPVDLPFAQAFMEYIYWRKLLGHQFGIPLDHYDTGLGFTVNMRTEGLCPSLEVALNTSIKEFFGKEVHLKKLLDLFLADKTPPSSTLLENFQKGLPIFWKGIWPSHFTRLSIVKNILFVFNRGAWREKGATAGIQVYVFEDPSKLKEEHLTALQRSPDSILNEERRVEIGLRKERYATFPDDEQPGGFCFWNNTKSFVQWLLALSTIPEERNLAMSDYLKLLRQGFDTTRELYKAWSTFDREQGIQKVLAFHHMHPEIEPDIPLLLFVLANSKIKNKQILSKLSSFINKQDLKDLHFLSCDKNGKNLLHHLSNGDNLNEFEYLLEEQIDSIFAALANAPDKAGVRPLDLAIKKNKWEIVAELIGDGVYLLEEQRIQIYTALFEHDDVFQLQKFEEVKRLFAEQTTLGYTGLHYAISYDATRCIEYLQFIKNETNALDYEEYAKACQQLWRRRELLEAK